MTKRFTNGGGAAGAVEKKEKSRPSLQKDSSDNRSSPMDHGRRGQSSVRGDRRKHLELEEIAVFVSHKTSSQKRVSITLHLADCARCRKTVAEVVLSRELVKDPEEQCPDGKKTGKREDK